MATVFVNCNEAGAILGISGRQFRRRLEEDEDLRRRLRLEFKSKNGELQKVMFLRREVEALKEEREN